MPTVLKVHPPNFRITAHTTMPGLCLPDGRMVDPNEWAMSKASLAEAGFEPTTSWL
jgi:hypothetical protein